MAGGRVWPRGLAVVASAVLASPRLAGCDSEDERARRNRRDRGSDRRRPRVARHWSVRRRLAALARMASGVRTVLPLLRGKAARWQRLAVAALVQHSSSRRRPPAQCPDRLVGAALAAGARVLGLAAGLRGQGDRVSNWR